ncbi:MAG: SCO family protein [Pseudorhodoplanes sp.]|nr:SCO family protein [Pseudorhodoplanes sp.]
MPRTTRIVIILAAFLGGLLVFTTALFLLTGRPTPQVSTASAVGGPFELTDQNGNTITDESLKGRPFLIFFGFTHCPDICPTALFEMSEILTKLGPDAGKINALFVTVDPERDTPARLKDYLSSFNPQLRGVTGSAEALDKMLKSYRVYYKKVPLKDGDYTMDHTALVYLMDKQGRFVAPFNIKRTPEAAAEDLRKYL